MDFGHSVLFRKVKMGESVNIESSKVLSRDEAERLVDTLKQKMSDSVDGEYMLHTYSKIMSTL